MTLLEFNGKTDSLLTESPDGSMKCTNLFYLGDDPMDKEGEIFHVSITSTALNKKHDKFDTMLGKNIRVTVEVLDEEEKK